MIKYTQQWLDSNPGPLYFSDLDKQNDHLTQKAKASCAQKKEKCVGMVLNWDGSAAEYFFKI